jgi:hypothetical protein
MVPLLLYRGRSNCSVRMIRSPLWVFGIGSRGFDTKLNQDLMSDYARPDVELVVPHVNNAAAPATQLPCLQLPTPDALTCLGDSGGHIQRGISRILRALAYLDLLAFCSKTFPTGLYA